MHDEGSDEWLWKELEGGNASHFTEPQERTDLGKILNPAVVSQVIALANGGGHPYLSQNTKRWPEVLPDAPINPPSKNWIF